MKLHFKISLSLFLIFTLLINVASYSQSRVKNNFYSKEKKISKEIKKVFFSDKVKEGKFSRDIFKRIEKALNNRNINNLSKYIKHQTYLNLSNQIEGYYSENQVFYILKNFIKRNQITSFKLNSIVNDVENPFALGKYSHTKEGKVKFKRFYISLKRVNDSWKILQITLN